jgi:hypothetical protein
MHKKAVAGHEDQEGVQAVTGLMIDASENICIEHGELFLTKPTSFIYVQRRKERRAWGEEG